VNTISSLYIISFIVIFCFPAALPVDAASMNYSCLITGGLTAFVGAWWFVRRHDYVGPQELSDADGMLAQDAK
jgi:choline transport protein